MIGFVDHKPLVQFSSTTRYVNHIAIEVKVLVVLFPFCFLLCDQQLSAAERKDIGGMWVRTNNSIILLIAVVAWLQVTIHDTTNNMLTAHESDAIAGPVISVDMGSANANKIADQVLLLLIGCLNAR